jgi:hypothetical protein
VCTPSVTESIAPGELIDKITIFEIKAKRITGAEKLRHVQTELALLADARDQWIFESEELAGLIAEPKLTSEQLWRTKFQHTRQRNDREPTGSPIRCATR